MIDAHCHIFNARDLQVAGFIGAKVPEPLWGPMAPLLLAFQAIAWQLAPSIDAERRWLRRRANEAERRRAPDSVASEGNTVAALDNDSNQALEEFFLQARSQDKTTVDNFLGRLQAEYLSQGMVDARAAAMGPLTADTIGELRTLETTSAVNARGAMNFLATFFRYRTQNAWEMLQIYGCDSTPGVDLLCPALVDFDLWLGSGPTPSGIHEQVDLMGDIARVTGGRVFAYAPFNPLRAACEGEAYSRPLFDAVRAGKCAGFKLYPPMGFSAMGNAGNKFEPLPGCADGRKISSSKLDAVLGGFFDDCARYNIPVMAHASPSNSARDGTENLAAPKFWRHLLGSHAPSFLEGRSRLRVSLGHMGGGGDHKDNSDWREQIIEAMERFPGQLYADLSHHLRTLDRDTSAMRQTMGFLRKGGAAAQQTLYGSDWSMLARQTHAGRYLARFDQALRDTGLDDSVRSQVLGGNATRFLGLDSEVGGGGRRKSWLGKRDEVAVMP